MAYGKMKGGRGAVAGASKPIKAGGGGGKTTKVGPISTPFTNAMKTSIGGKR